MSAARRRTAPTERAAGRASLRLVGDVGADLLGERLATAPAKLRAVLAGVAKPDTDLKAKGDALIAGTDKAADEAAKAARTENRRASYLRRRPTRYVSAGYGILKPKQNPQGLIGRWLASPLQNLLLAGPSRTGKSTAAYAIANDAHGQDLWVEAWAAQHLYDALRKGDDAAFGVKLRVTECDLLLVDDLGRERVTDVWQGLLHQLLEDRFTNGRRQVLTANAPIDPTAAYGALVDRYGDPVIERILDGGGMVIFDGPKWRNFSTSW